MFGMADLIVLEVLYWSTLYFFTLRFILCVLVLLLNIYWQILHSAATAAGEGRVEKKGEETKHKTYLITQHI